MEHQRPLFRDTFRNRTEQRYLEKFEEPMPPHRRDELAVVESRVHEPMVDVAGLSHIVIPGACLRPTPGGGWELAANVENDASRSKVVGGLSRAIAAREVYDQGFRGTFLVTGGVQEAQFQPPGATEPYTAHMSRAHALSHMMVSKFKIPPRHVKTIGAAGYGNTWGNVSNTLDYIRTNPDIDGFGLMANEWQMMRAYYMFMNSEIGALGIDIHPLFVEDVLTAASYAPYRRWAYGFIQLPQMDVRECEEVEGTADFIKGVYRSKSK